MSKPLCPECNYYDGHHYSCSLLTVEEAREIIKKLLQTANKNWSEYNDRLSNAYSQRQLWHGKYMIVKHENNELRKKVVRREKESRTEPIINYPTKSE